MQYRVTHSGKDWQQRPFLVWDGVAIHSFEKTLDAAEKQRDRLIKAAERRTGKQEENGG